MELGFPGRGDTLLAVIDVQEKFRSRVFEFDRVVRNVRKVVEGFRLLGLPVVATEQYPRVLVQQCLRSWSPLED